MNLSLFVDESGSLLSRPHAEDELALLASLLVLESECPSLEQDLRAIKHNFGLAPAVEVKASEYAIAVGRRSGIPPRVAHLKHLCPDDVGRLFQSLCARIAQCKNATTVCVCVKKSLVYDPSWLRQRSGNAVDPDGLVTPMRVYEACYQELIQRAAKEAEALGAELVTTYVDYHQAFDERWKDRSGKPQTDLRRITEIHHRLTRRHPRYSWGQPLDRISDAVAPLPSHLNVGLQAADLVAGAFRDWLGGHFHAPFAPLARLIRRHNGSLYRYGFVCVPKSQAFVGEPECVTIARKARDAGK